MTPKGIQGEGKYEAVHPQSPRVMSLGGLRKRNEGNLQRKRGRKKASYFLKYSFAPDGFTFTQGNKVGYLTSVRNLGKPGAVECKMDSLLVTTTTYLV